MKREFCIAAVRLIYDIIGADSYVSDRELDIMDNVLNDKYGLNDPDSAKEIFREVNKKTFCDALKTLQNWEDRKEVNDLIDELKIIAGVGKINHKCQKFTTIEGHCSLSEAWLLLAVEYAINENATVFSIRKSDYRFARSEIIYMENSEENKSIHKEMLEHYEEYKARLELVGMRLIYVPKVCAYLKHKREQRKLKSLMRYVSPFHKYEDQDAQKIVDNIDKITTKEFAKDLFLQENEIYNNLKPSFLMKISTSVIEKDSRPIKKSNFVLIPIDGSIDETLKKALSIYQRYSLDLHIPEKKLHGRPFRLHGFDRTFLNFVMAHVLNTEKLTKILYDFSFEKKKVFFVFDERRTVSIPLGNKQMCLYLLIIIFSNYKHGVRIEKAIKKKTGFLLDVEKAFFSIYNKVKEKSGSELYDGKGKIATDISRISQKMKDIPSTYHVRASNNKALTSFPSKDIVYIKFDRKELLLDEEIERIKSRDNKIKLEDICCVLFR